MARSWFGGTSNDWLMGTIAAFGATVVTLNGGQVTGTCWSAQTGGVQYTDLLDVNGVPMSVLTVSGASLPSFQGPDGVVAIWADFGAGRVLLETRDQATAAAASATAAKTSETAAKTSETNAANSAAAAQAVGDTNDTIMAGVVNNSASATNGAMIGKYAATVGVSPSGVAATDTTNLQDALTTAAAFSRTPTVVLAPGTYTLNAPLVIKPNNAGTTNVPAPVPSIIAALGTGAGRIGDEADTAVVRLVASPTFPLGSFLIDYQQVGTVYGGSGANVVGLVIDCANRAAGIRGQGLRKSRFAQLSIIDAAVPVTPGDGARGALSLTTYTGGGNAPAYNVIEQVMVTNFAGDGFHDNTNAENTYLACRAFTAPNATSASYRFDTSGGTAVDTNHAVIDCHYGGGAYGMVVGAGCSVAAWNFNLFQSVPWPQRNALLIQDGWQYNLAYYYPPTFTNCHFVNDPPVGAVEQDGAVIRFEKISGSYQIGAVFTGCTLGTGSSNRTTTWIYSDLGLVGNAHFRDCFFLGAPTITQIEDQSNVVGIYDCIGVANNRGPVSGEVHSNTNSASIGGTPIDVPDLTVTIAPKVAGKLTVTATLDLTVAAATDELVGKLVVDGADNPLYLVCSPGAAGARLSTTRSWNVPLAAGSHTVKMQVWLATGSGTTGHTNALTTGMTYEFMPN